MLNDGKEEPSGLTGPRRGKATAGGEPPSPTREPSARAKLQFSPVFSFGEEGDAFPTQVPETVSTAAG